MGRSCGSQGWSVERLERIMLATGKARIFCCGKTSGGIRYPSNGSWGYIKTPDLSETLAMVKWVVPGHEAQVAARREAAKLRERRGLPYVAHWQGVENGGSFVPADAQSDAVIQGLISELESGALPPSDAKATWWADREWLAMEDVCSGVEDSREHAEAVALLRASGPTCVVKVWEVARDPRIQLHQARTIGDLIRARAWAYSAKAPALL